MEYKSFVSYGFDEMICSKVIEFFASWAFVDDQCWGGLQEVFIFMSDNSKTVATFYTLFFKGLAWGKRFIGDIHRR